MTLRHHVVSAVYCRYFFNKNWYLNSNDGIIKVKIVLYRILSIFNIGY